MDFWTHRGILIPWQGLHEAALSIQISWKKIDNGCRKIEGKQDSGCVFSSTLVGAGCRYRQYTPLIHSYVKVLNIFKVYFNICYNLGIKAGHDLFVTLN